MHFDYIDCSHKYLEDILCIIRQGISRKQMTLTKGKREGLNSQSLVEALMLSEQQELFVLLGLELRKSMSEKIIKGKKIFIFI